MVERAANGRSVVRELRSQPPLTLVPQRAVVPSADGAAVVHLVGSATSPLGGDNVTLRVVVRAGARLRLRGTAATLALPGQRGGESRNAVRIDVAEAGSVEYLPEPTVITARAHHRAELRVALAEGAKLTAREVLVLGRSGEPPGRLHTSTHLVRCGVPLLRQDLAIGDPRLGASTGYLAGARVLATQAVVWDHDPIESYSTSWSSLVPLAHRGALASALADDVVTAQRRLDAVLQRHPDACQLRH